MLELVVTACLLSGDRACKKIEVPLEKDVTISTCLKTAHARALDWQAENTSYMVVGWQCKDSAATKPSQSSK